MKKFGIWHVDINFGLVGKVNDGYDYNIAKERLWETQGDDVSDWLIHLAEKTWITRENVDDLNNAFIYCLDFFKEFKPDNAVEIDIEKSILEQKNILNFR